jgi:hypothetical protein
MKSREPGIGRHVPTPQSGRLTALAVLFTILSTPGPEAGAAAAIEEAERFFNSGAIPHLKIEVAQTNLNKLRRNPRDYVRATVREGENVYEEVGIHLKGAAGSFRPLDGDKPAFTLNFDKFVDRQKFHGLDKLSLNNSVQDPSYMTEAICSELFLAAGVPTPRTGYARVSLNGRDLRLYVLKEGFDKAFLRRHFKNIKGNLYDGGFLHDITEPLERTSGEGDVPRRADLKALADAAQDSDPTNRLARLEQVLDVDRFLSFAAIEMMTWHWDGYLLKKNNYRVYHDPDSGKMTFLPHGMDQMFWDPNGPILTVARTEGLIARALLQPKEGRRRYFERVESLLTNVFTVDRLTNHLNELRARIRPVLAAISPEEARQHDNAVTNLTRQMVQRVHRVRLLVSEPEPQPIRFDASGTASLTQWQKLDIRGTGRLEDRTESDGRKTLYVAAGSEGRCTASWRVRVVLRPGNYVFEGRARTAGVVQLQKDVATKGVGAGLRQSQGQSRKHSLIGDTEWQPIEYEFSVENEPTDILLLCELRAEKGEAWFDLASLKLRRR